jgi:hypothetical protein
MQSRPAAASIRRRREVARHRAFLAKIVNPLVGSILRSHFGTRCRLTPLALVHAERERRAKMDIRVAGHQVATGESLRSHVSERLSAIADRYFSRAVAANVTFGRGL